MVAVLGGIHLESLSHLSSFFLAAGLVDLGDDFGDLIHVEVSGDLDGPDGHCHDDGGVGTGVGVVAVVVIFLLGFMTTLLGQLNFKFGGLFAR